MVQVSRDSRIWALWVLILVGIGYSCNSGKLDWKIAAGLLVTLGLPSILGAKKEVRK
jgi:hypothetical protein